VSSASVRTSVLVDADEQKVNAVNGLTARASGLPILPSFLPGSPDADGRPSNEAPAAAASGALTPAMRQYHDAKRQYRDAIVFFRMGDFYEMFFEDALVASRALELTLTSRSKDRAAARFRCAACRSTPSTVPRAARAEGLPRRDLRSGRGPEKAKGVVRARCRAWCRRDAARRQLPGRARAGVHDEPRPDRGDRIGAALLDLTTGEFTVAEYAGPSAGRP
jgi:DNA mismatch repair protein MutS